MSRLKYLFSSLRPQQWIKNLLLFSAIFFNGKVLNWSYVQISCWGFLIFCLISSSSYLINDIIDLPYDIKHPLKKLRPLAAGLITTREALWLAILLLLLGLGMSLTVGISFFCLAIVFVLLHIFYSAWFKKFALLDIFTIALSFLIRVVAGEILTGYHLSVWLLLTVFFSALFIASAKRHSELVRRGTKSRQALYQYQERLLNFYVSTFATAAILSYALFTFLQPPLQYDSWLAQALLHFNQSKMVERKWLLLTSPLVVFGFTRYAQLVYVGKKGERPEKLITTDPYLIASIVLWSVIVFLVLYL